MPQSSSMPGRDVNASVALVDLPVGGWGRVRQVDLAACDRALLGALGVTGRSPLKLCQLGNPCIIEVRGTRIGLAETVARRLWVEPEDLQG